MNVSSVADTVCDSNNLCSLFRCPISNEIMRDPVICADGITYERKNILSWFEQNTTSFTTKAVLSSMALIPNSEIKALIDQQQCADGEGDAVSYGKKRKHDMETADWPENEKLPKKDESSSASERQQKTTAGLESSYRNNVPAVIREVATEEPCPPPVATATTATPTTTAVTTAATGTAAAVTQMQLFVKTLSNTTISVKVSSEGTVGDLMRRIFESEGIRPDLQRIIFSGKQLDSATLLADYGVKDHNVLHLVLRLFGGGCSAAAQTKEHEL